MPLHSIRWRMRKLYILIDVRLSSVLFLANLIKPAWFVCSVFCVGMSKSMSLSVNGLWSWGEKERQRRVQ